MLRLKANKTNLYKLVAAYESLPPMHRTEFIKAYRCTDYWLEWSEGAGLSCKAFFSVCGGKPLLAITKKEFCGAEISRVVHAIDVRDC